MQKRRENESQREEGRYRPFRSRIALRSSVGPVYGTFKFAYEMAEKKFSLTRCQISIPLIAFLPWYFLPAIHERNKKGLSAREWA